jgi:hypothetical protein
MAGMTADPPLVCSSCQQPVEDRDLDFRFHLPDPLFEIPEAERRQRVQGNGDMVGARGVGTFVRVLLPRPRRCSVVSGLMLVG